MNHCSIENKLCSIATDEGKCPVSACIKKNETVHAVYKEGKKVWPPEDPIDVYDAMAKRFDHIENELRSMRAELAEIIRDAVVQPNTYVYKPTAPTIYWPQNGIPEACRSCTNHPSNGGTGICHCTLGSPSVTSGVVWTKDSIENQPSSYSTTTSTDCPWKGDK